MKTINLLLCILLTAMSFNLFANDNDRYETVAPTNQMDVYITDKKTKEYHEFNRK